MYIEEIISHAIKISSVVCTFSCINILVTIPDLEWVSAEGQISTSVHVLYVRNYLLLMSQFHPKLISNVSLKLLIKEITISYIML